MNKDERMAVRWILRIAGSLIGVAVSLYVYNSTLSTNIANGVSPNQSSYVALIYAIVVLAFWIGVLEVIVRIGLPGESGRGRRGFGH